MAPRPPMRAVLFLPDSQNPYHRLSAEGAASAAQRHGITLEVVPAESGSPAQVRQVQEALARAPRPDVVLIMPVQEADMTPLSVQAAESGVGWFWLSRSDGRHAELRTRFPGVPICL